jgi:LysR family glycine cleavage system transcriptional activator
MLRAFEAVARHQSVTLAAAELHVTQGAVSHQVMALEHWLDAKLVQREGRRIVLTTAGAAYAPSLSTALDLMADATLSLPASRPAERITVSAFSTLATYWLIPRLADFCAENPAVDVDLSTNYARYDFDPAASDVSIRCYTSDELRSQLQRRDWRGVEAGRFLGETMTLVCSPALVTPARLLRSSLMTSGNTRCWRAAQRQRSGRNGCRRPASTKRTGRAPGSASTMCISPSMRRCRAPAWRWHLPRCWPS